MDFPRVPSTGALYASSRPSRFSVDGRGSVMDALDFSDQVRVEFTELSSSVELPKAVWKDKEVPETKEILRCVSGAVNPGDMVALMGPSGAGKSSLLTAVAGRSARSVVLDGTVRYNGRELGESMKKKVAFVTQDDLMLGGLTVLETLQYTAELSLPKSVGKKEKALMVNELIRILDLKRCSSTVIRNVGPSISGGERKRVSIAQELLISPSVIFLDEPTSGLDSASANILISTLNYLAKGGRTILCTIHQPSSAMFKSFNKLMLMSNGETMYSGRVDCCLEWFTALGAECPMGFAAPEFMIELASGPPEIAAAASDSDKEPMKSGEPDVEIALDPAVQREDLVLAFSMWSGMNSSDPTRRMTDGVTEKDIESASALMEGIKTGQGVTSKVGATGQGSSRLRFSSSSGKTSDSDDGELPEDELNFMDQFLILYNRGIAYRKLDADAWQRTALTFALCVTFGVVWFRAGNLAEQSAQSISDIAGFFFAFLMLISTVNFITQMVITPPDMPVFMKERASGRYGALAWLLSRTLIEFRLEAPYIIFQVVFLYLFVELRPAILSFFSMLLVTLLTAFACQGAGQMFGVLSVSWPTANLINTAFFQFNVFTCGFIVTLSPFWDWLKYISILRTAWVPYLFIQNRNEVVVVCPDEIFDNGPACTLVSWRTILGPDSNTEPSVLYCILFLVGFSIVARVGTWFTLSLRRLENEK